MPLFQTPAGEMDVSRNALLVDTNVLVGAFWPGDQNHDVCQLIFETDQQLLIPVSVIIETWGMLVGSIKRWDCGLEFLSWITNPGTHAAIVRHREQIDTVRELMQQIHVDCVDAVLAYLADQLTEQCELKPPARIATFDTADFIKCMMARKLRLTLLDMNTLDEY